MKTLILTDEAYKRLTDALTSSEAGWSVLREFERAPEAALPSDRDLIRLARTNGESPAVFERARQYRDAGRQAATDTRLEMERLIRHAHGAGVGPSVLSRWFGLKPTRIWEIVSDDRASDVRSEES